MNTKRNIRKSAMGRARELLAAPPAASGLSTPFNVYDIAQLRANWQKTFTPIRPFAFVVESRLRPGVSGFPLIMVTAAVTYQSFELGNTAGGQAVIDVHVVGRFSGERDDLADLFAKHFGRQLALYDYSSGTPVLIEKAMVEDKVATWDEEIDAQALRDEGSYDYWEVVRFVVDFLR